MTALAGGAGYVRLLHGPISLRFLVAPIERELASEIGVGIVRIDDAIVRLTDSNRIEFRLSNVRLADSDGQPIASAPLAAVELAGSALWSGRVVPSRIELIDPRLLLSYTPEAGLSVSFARMPDSPAGQASGQPQDAKPSGSGLPSELQRIDIARALAESSARARRGEDATSHLREIGLRNATVVIEQPGGVTAWRVPELAIDLEHKQKRSIISGKATILSGRAPWSLAFRSEESEKAQTIVVNLSIRDLVPRTLSRALPQLGLLDGFDVPVDGDAALELSRGGDVLAGSLSVELSRGRIQLPWLADVTFPVDAGLVDLRYDRERGLVEVAPSAVRWGQSRATLVGSIANKRTAAGDGWAFDLRATEGAVAAEEFGIRPIPLETFVIAGHAVHATRQFELSRLQVKAGGAEVSLGGVVDAAGDTTNASFEGRIGPMPLSVLKALWPRALAPGARTWIGERVTRGQLQGGTFKWLAGRYLERQSASPDVSGQRLSLAVEAADVAMRPMRTMSPIEAPRALIRLEGGAIEIGMPEAAVVVGSGKRVPLKGGRFTAVDLFSDRPLGEVAFRVVSPLPPVLDVLDQEPLSLVRKAGITLEAVDGKVDAPVKLTLPLVTALEADDVQIEGKARITEGRARKLVGPFDVQGATINIDFTDPLIEAQGEMLVGGVPAAVHWQRRVEQGQRSSQLKLTSRLDNSDRNQLGLDVNHILLGEVPVEVLVTPVAGREEPHVSVKADLTNAEMVLDAIAWRKPPGSRADVSFELNRSKARTELTGFRIRGDNIAADGQIVMGPDNRLREFSFPSFTLNVVSQLEISGAVRSDNILDVKAKGRHFDGREFFRSLFSVGQVTDKPLQPPKSRAGLDLTAEIENLAGYSEASLRGLRVRLSKRADKLVAMEARGTLDSGKPLTVSLAAGETRRLVARSDDAGQAMRLVGFYPNMQGGRMMLEVNLDGKGPAEKTGLLRVEDFRVLGDPVISDIVSSADSQQGTGNRGGGQRGQVVRQAFDFDRMRVPFSVGYGQFVLEDSYMRGGVMGVSLRGKVDYKSGRMSLGGTYIPLQGLNNALGGIPVLGQILSGPRGEGILGITFAVQGSMQQPQVSVNPLSLLAPGIFRSMTEMTAMDPQVTPREEAKPSGGQPRVRSVGPEGAAGAAPSGAKGRAVQPEVIGGWSSEQQQIPAPIPKKK